MEGHQKTPAKDQSDRPQDTPDAGAEGTTEGRELTPEERIILGETRDPNPLAPPGNAQAGS
ncbi:hypothetical protein LWE61_02300 [Sphingobium sufflavum]|uniref:hypothetical protein n=1 Tax=Sphingobium sufflavum TaxID=1129547 RepID=UPI001F26CDF4|nr:hypothetical protein [Sphingobium sufflavum]MCE7795383.1 hypothetical protein [Sphingobium sufflavum]